MRILFLGDIVGKPGYSAVLKHAEAVRKQELDHQLDFLVSQTERYVNVLARSIQGGGAPVYLLGARVSSG